MSDARLKLINEICSRPGLWDVQNEDYKTRAYFSELWKEVAAKMGPNVTVDECKRKWKNLRDAYRAEIRRIHIRIERDIFKGRYDPRKNYKSKWAYFEHMKFIKDINRRRRSYYANHLSASSNDYTDDVNESEELAQSYNTDEGDISRNSQTYSEELLDATELKQQDHTINYPLLTVKEISTLQDNLRETGNAVNDNPAHACWKCFKGSYDHMHYINDSDYNFLISFLPQLKKMSELQNLQFRAKMADFIFTIMS